MDSPYYSVQGTDRPWDGRPAPALAVANGWRAIGNHNRWRATPPEFGTEPGVTPGFFSQLRRLRGAATRRGFGRYRPAQGTDRTARRRIAKRTRSERSRGKFSRCRAAGSTLALLTGIGKSMARRSALTACGWFKNRRGRIDADVSTVIRLRGTVETAVTAGDPQFQVANNGASSGRTTSVKTNSFLKIGKF